MITVTETTSAHRLVSSRRISLCRHILGAGAALALVGAAAMPAHADVIFSDFGPGGSFGSADFNIYGQGGSYVYIPQFQFTASASGALNEIDVSLDYGNKPGTVQVVLYSSVGNAVGSALGTWTLTGLPSYGSAIATAAGITGVNLVAGTSYFLAAMSINGTYSWNDNSQLVRGQTYDVQSGNSSNFGVETTGAFDLIGTTVSEPATLALLGAGIFGIAAIRRRRSA